jgi:D-alanyl-D-alanine carboxypeptidase/D-alanyl-D-alanine-endopeptidase (penicillin-binding protein 4)
VLVQSLDTGEVLYRLNPDTLVMPASNQKIVSTAVAAARLGWDFRFETRLEHAATVEAGTLRGDLFVVGTGDPTINAREGRDQSVFDELAAALKAAGVTRIDGRLVGDDSAFDDERFGYGWQWDDFAFGYSAPVGPLQVHMNTVEVSIAPGSAAGAPAVVTLRPDVGEFVVVNRTVTGPAGAEARAGVARYPARRELVVEGTVPAGGKPVVRTAAVDNPTSYFAAVLKDALAARGIAVTGEAVDIDDMVAGGAAPPVAAASVPPPAVETAPSTSGSSPAPRTVLARVVSPPLSELSKTLMKISQNLYAETALRALSLSPGPATVDASQKVVEQVLSRWGIAPRTYITADGSGLSRNNYVNASMIVAILRAVARDPQLFEPFLATMPVAGEDGTLAGRMKGTRAAGNVKAKTGTIANVRSLSGYLTTAAGERIVFAMIANNFTTPSAVVDAAVEGALERVIAAPGPSR